MTEPVPDLDEMIRNSRTNIGPCILVARATTEQVAEISKRVEQGTRKWRTYERWLKAQDVEVSCRAIQVHYERDHAPDK